MSAPKRFILDGRCHSKARSTGKRCTRPVQEGARFCARHFGNTKKEQVITIVNRERMKLSQRLVEIDIPDESPAQAILRMVTVSSRAERALSLYLAELQSDNLLEIETEAYYQMWSQERDRLAKVAGLAIQAGASAEMVEIARSEGRQIVDLVLSILGHPEMKLSRRQMRLAKEMTADKLREEQAG